MGILNYLAAVTLISFHILSCVAYDDDPNNDKVSLGFVIDDTGSMADDIAGVLDGCQAIFDTVVKSPHSPVIDYVLATFNDPTTNFRIVTKDGDAFIRVLKTITVHGGGDCPEMCLHGIKLGIENSRYGSFLYIFTDASAKDYSMYTEIKTMALRRGVKITFVLTGMCGGYDDADYTVYEDLAHATGGIVFHLGKTDIKDILAYVRYTVEAPTTLLVSEKFPPGYGHEVDFKTDPLMHDPLIAVTGDKPKLDVTGPDGSRPPLRPMVKKPRIEVVTIPDSPASYAGDVGNLHDTSYTAVVGSSSETTVTIIAHTDVQFKFAFATFLPPLYRYTTTRPVAGVKSYVAARLIEGDIELNYIKILDMDFNIVSYTPLSILNVPEKSYVTDYTIDLPKTMFRVAVEGLDPVTMATITRIATVPVEPQSMDEKDSDLAPKVTVDNDHVRVKFGDPVRLYCRVKGLPKPDIVWVQKGVGKSLPANVEVSELPYDYISVLSIDRITEDVTYTCSGKNSLGSDSKDIYVEMLPTHYLKVYEKPKDTEVEAYKEVKLTCRVSAYPKASITWYKGDRAVEALTKNTTNIMISADKMELTILSMQPEDQDTYVCIAQNDIAKKWLPAEVKVTNVDCLIDLSHVYKLQPLVLSSQMEWPRFFKDHGKMIVTPGESLVLYCLRGFKDFALRFVTATCEGGSMFNVNGFSVNFNTIYCNEPMEHVVESTGEDCLPGFAGLGNTELLKIGFGSDKVLNAYEVCFDNVKNIPLYTKNVIPRITTEVELSPIWEDADDFYINFDELYDCRQQIDTISTTLGKWFHREDGCCFRKQLLVDQKDVFPGVAQKAVFSYLNVVPIWSTCESSNWDHVKKAVQDLAQKSELTVFTGISGDLILPTIYGVNESIIIVDKANGEGQQIPLYLWKVVQNPTTKSSVAIVQINVPDLRLEEIHSYVRCVDICDKITWLNGPDLKKEAKGYVYCCTLKSFEDGIGFSGVFEPLYNILY